jgi:ParB/RepB/Spo0J family partition protein
MASISEHGLIVPVTVLKRKDGSFELIKGQGRYEAHKKLGRTHIRAFVIPEEDMDVYQKTVEWLVENRVREELPSVLKARFAELDRQRGLSYEEIGRRYGMSPATARQYAKMAQKSSERVLQMVEEDKLDFTSAKMIAEGVNDRDSQEAVAEVVVSEKAGPRGTRAVVRIAQQLASSSDEPVTIPQLRERTRDMGHQRSLASRQLIVLQERRDVLLRHTRELAREQSFVDVVKASGRTLPEEM